MMMPDGSKIDNEQVTRSLYCAGLALGVIIALGGYGILQERIMSVPYEGELFRASAFLVLCNRIAAALYAVAMAKWNGETLQAAAPIYKYCLVSFSNVGATMCQYEALKWVSFPVQMLGKSFKMLPVMFWGIIISGKKYTMKDWLIAASVTGGVMMFLMGGQIKAPKGKSDDSVYGLLLLGMFLALDGFTSTFQEKLFKDHKTTKYNQMLYVNTSSACVALVGLLVSGDLFTALSFCATHPSLPLDAAGISASAVAGQFFIVSMVKEFGALTLAATMNVRQLSSILVSFVLYGHPLAALQLLGLVNVFGALFSKSLSGLTNAGKAKSKPAPTKELEVTQVGNPSSTDVEKGQGEIDPLKG